MANVGDDAQAAGYALVPDTGEEGRVRWGAREINRTRDYLAQVLKLIPKSRHEYREAAGIKNGTANPSGGDNGDVYFKVI